MNENFSGIHTISIVIPVYCGEKTLPPLFKKIDELIGIRTSPSGNKYKIIEVILVHDCGPDRSDETLIRLEKTYDYARVIWLSRNFGQHAATMAGMASASGDWIVTIDEDGQQEPLDIALLLDEAVKRSLQLVYAKPINPPPHGWLRNFLSNTAKIITTKLLGNSSVGRFNSFRLVDGEIGRTLAAYCGSGVFLDVGLFWIVNRVGHCPVTLNAESGRPSGYSYLKLFSHFWNLVVTTGVRPLRLITQIGFSSIILAFLISCYALYGKFISHNPVQGWTSVIIIVSFFSGAILTSLGVIAEYLAITMGIVMGRPLYVAISKPRKFTSESES